MNATNSNQRVLLMKDSFTPSEVSHLVIKSIDNQINSYKLKNLSNWIHDHNCDQSKCAEKIQVLQKRKEELMNIIHTAQANGKILTVADKLEIGFA